MSINECIEQFKRCNENIKSLEEVKRTIMAKALPLICSLNVGDIIDIEGSAWKGKKGRVLKVYVVWRGHEQDFTWGVSCIVMKKDGTESKKITSFVKNMRGD